MAPERTHRQNTATSSSWVESLYDPGGLRKGNGQSRPVKERHNVRAGIDRDVDRASPCGEAGMLAVAQFITTLTSTVFAGAAIYISLVEHPARMQCDTRTAATVWAPSYRRATMTQAPLAVLSCIASVLAWWLGGVASWLVGALLIGSVVPVTLVIIKPTNAQLLMQVRDLASAETRALLEKWGRLHAVRSVLRLTPTLIFLP